MFDNESKCPVSGKRMYATEREALATAAHQIASANAPKDLRAYLAPGVTRGILQKMRKTEKVADKRDPAAN